jgi:hypothetical protein
MANITGQGPNTGAQEFLKQLESRIRAATARYQLAHAALLALRGPGAWQSVLQTLRQLDVCGLSEWLLSLDKKNRLLETQQLAGLLDADFPNEPTEPLPTVAPSKGRRVLSWIWYSVSRLELAANLAGNLNDSICIEWTKSCARAARWEEEVILLEEEMQRVISFCQWKATWWRQRSDEVALSTAVLLEGAMAYAAEHEAFELRFLSALEVRWGLVWLRASEKVNEQEGIEHRADSIIEVLIEPPEIEDDDD